MIWDTIEVARGVGCKTDMYFFSVLVDFVISYLLIAGDIVPCNTHGPIIHPNREELVVQARHRQKEEHTSCQLLRKKCLISCIRKNTFALPWQKMYFVTIK